MRKLLLLALLVVLAGCIGEEWVTAELGVVALDYPSEWNNFTEDHGTYTLNNGTLAITVASGSVENATEIHCGEEIFSLSIEGSEEDLSEHEWTLELITDSFRCLDEQKEKHEAETGGH